MYKCAHYPHSEPIDCEDTLANGSNALCLHFRNEWKDINVPFGSLYTYQDEISECPALTFWNQCVDSDNPDSIVMNENSHRGVMARRKRQIANIL